DPYAAVLVRTDFLLFFALLAHHLCRLDAVDARLRRLRQAAVGPVAGKEVVRAGVGVTAAASSASKLLGRVHVLRPDDQVLLIFRLGRVALDRDKTSWIDRSRITMDAASLIEGLLGLEAKLRVVFALVLLVVFVMVVVYFELRMSVFFRSFLRCLQILPRLQIVVVIEVDLAGAQPAI